jgi:hypothetical protein
LNRSWLNDSTLSEDIQGIILHFSAKLFSRVCP